MTQRIGLYGGSFNPIHSGHLIVARSVAERIKLDRVYLLPSAQPPHKVANELETETHRVAMIRLAISDEPLFALSDFDLVREGPSYTFDTVAHFQDRLGSDTALYWLIGADWFEHLPTWHRAGELVDACEIVTAVRPGWSGFDGERLARELGSARADKLRRGVVETPLIGISSTDVRRRVQQGRSIRYLVPDAVAAYIAAERLYAGE